MFSRETTQAALITTTLDKMTAEELRLLAEWYLRDQFQVLSDFRLAEICRLCKSPVIHQSESDLWITFTYE